MIQAMSCQHRAINSSSSRRRFSCCTVVRANKRIRSWTMATATTTTTSPSSSSPHLPPPPCVAVPYRSTTVRLFTKTSYVKFNNSTADKDGSDDLVPPTSLLHFRKTKLTYPSKVVVDDESSEDSSSYSPSLQPAFETQPFNWTILKPQIEGGRGNTTNTRSRSRSSSRSDDPKQHQLQDAEEDQIEPCRRGYLLLGRNGSGKSLVGQALMETNDYRSRQYELQQQQQQQQDKPTSPIPSNSYVKDGCIDVEDVNKWHSQSVAYVSFDSHQELLQQRSTKVIGRNDGEDNAGSSTGGGSITAFRAVAGDGVSKLNKASQFLVVRFGLYSLLHRPVSTLSTGEIRKVLLIRALSKRPHLLVLDNAFDGLDVPSREILKDIVKRTLKGFTQDILVHDVAAKATAKTQVVLMTHRVEEMIIPDIENVASLSLETGPPSTSSTSSSSSSLTSKFRLLEYDIDVNTSTLSDSNVSESNDGWVEDHVDEDNSKNLELAQSIMLQALGVKNYDDDGDDGTPSCTSSRYDAFQWDDPKLPPTETIEKWWKPKSSLQQPDERVDESCLQEQPVLVQTKDLSIRRGAEGEVTLLHNLDWTVRQGERWLVGGGNGAGKSTLSRLLAQPEEERNEFNSGVLDIQPSTTTAWVSTESHLRQIEELKVDGKHGTTVQTLLGQLSNDADWNGTILPVVEWLGLMNPVVGGSRGGNHVADLLSRPFLQLSQGQQKMVLIAGALASQPSLLVLDEPCQGLDLLNRQEMLTVVNRICESTSMSFVYITHHYEEVLPSVGHALHLKDRYAVFNGPIDDYDPSNYHDKL